jgi:Inhibitor of Apoptosis domain
MPAQGQRCTRPPNTINDTPWLQGLKLSLALHRFLTYPFAFEQETNLKRIDLANSGLYLSECKQLLNCYFCSGEIEISTPDLSSDEIDTMHKELSPRCPLFNESTENVPLVSSNCINHRFEAFRLYSLLLVEWSTPVSIYDLAHLGFMYANNENNVRCAFCKLEVRGWLPSDVIEQEHLSRRPECPFLSLQDVGNVPIGDEFLDSTTAAFGNSGMSSIMKSMNNFLLQFYLQKSRWLK